MKYFLIFITLLSILLCVLLFFQSNDPLSHSSLDIPDEIGVHLNIESDLILMIDSGQCDEFNIKKKWYVFDCSKETFDKIARAFSLREGGYSKPGAILRAQGDLTYKGYMDGDFLIFTHQGKYDPDLHNEIFFVREIQPEIYRVTFFNEGV